MTVQDRKARAYVFGNGPAGLMAAHAAASMGYDVEIGSLQKSPSQISGAQYLDRPIPGLTNDEPDSEVTFYKLGKAENYAKKVYGKKSAHTSWEKYEDRKKYPLWYLRDAYSKLWETYVSKMFLIGLNANVLASFMDTPAELIVVTVPLTEICTNVKHTFLSQPITVYDGLPSEIDVPWPDGHSGANFIVYNGKKKTPWYRCSSINGGKSIEVPGTYADGINIAKPLSTTCDCWAPVTGQPRLLLAGRYGKWQKDQLVSDAYQDVVNAVQ